MIAVRIRVPVALRQGDQERIAATAGVTVAGGVLAAGPLVLLSP